MGSGLFTVAFLIEFDGVSDKKKYLYYGSWKILYTQSLALTETAEVLGNRGSLEKKNQLFLNKPVTRCLVINLEFSV